MKSTHCTKKIEINSSFSGNFALEFICSEVNIYLIVEIFEKVNYCAGTTEFQILTDIFKNTYCRKKLRTNLKFSDNSTIKKCILEVIPQEVIFKKIYI